MTAVMNQCLRNSDLSQHISDSIIDLMSAIILLYQEPDVDLLRKGNQL